MFEEGAADRQAGCEGRPRSAARVGPTPIPCDDDARLRAARIERGPRKPEAIVGIAQQARRASKIFGRNQKIDVDRRLRRDCPIGERRERQALDEQQREFRPSRTIAASRGIRRPPEGWIRRSRGRRPPAPALPRWAARRGRSEGFPDQPLELGGISPDGQNEARRSTGNARAASWNPTRRSSPGRPLRGG